MLESVKGWIGNLVLTTGRILSVDAITEQFRVIRIETSAKASPGDKVQIDAGGFQLRTYSPFDIEASAFSVLALIHGDTPGSKWASGVTGGDKVGFLGPRSSGATKQKATVFGDETSIGVAKSLGVKAVIESTRVDETKEVTQRLGLDAHVVLRVPDETHLTEVTTQLREIGAPIVLTGRSTAIIEVRKRLRAHGFDPRAKAYWDPNRKGLD